MSEKHRFGNRLNNGNRKGPGRRNVQPAQFSNDLRAELGHRPSKNPRGNLRNRLGYPVDGFRDAPPVWNSHGAEDPEEHFEDGGEYDAGMNGDIVPVGRMHHPLPVAMRLGHHNGRDVRMERGEAQLADPDLDEGPDPGFPSPGLGFFNRSVHSRVGGKAQDLRSEILAKRQREGNLHDLRHRLQQRRENFLPPVPSEFDMLSDEMYHDLAAGITQQQQFPIEMEEVPPPSLKITFHGSSPSSLTHSVQAAPYRLPSTVSRMDPVCATAPQDIALEIEEARKKAAEAEQVRKKPALKSRVAGRLGPQASGTAENRVKRSAGEPLRKPAVERREKRGGDDPSAKRERPKNAALRHRDSPTVVKRSGTKAVLSSRMEKRKRSPSEEVYRPSNRTTKRVVRNGDRNERREIRGGDRRSASPVVRSSKYGALPKKRNSNDARHSPPSRRIRRPISPPRRNGRSPPARVYRDKRRASPPVRREVNRYESESESGDISPTKGEARRHDTREDFEDIRSGSDENDESRDENTFESISRDSQPEEPGSDNESEAEDSEEDLEDSTIIEDEFSEQREYSDEEESLPKREAKNQRETRHRPPRPITPEDEEDRAVDHYEMDLKSQRRSQAEKIQTRFPVQNEARESRELREREPRVVRERQTVPVNHIRLHVPNMGGDMVPAGNVGGNIMPMPINPFQQMNMASYQINMNMNNALMTMAARSVMQNQMQSFAARMPVHNFPMPVTVQHDVHKEQLFRPRSISPRKPEPVQNVKPVAGNLEKPREKPAEQDGIRQQIRLKPPPSNLTRISLKPASPEVPSGDSGSVSETETRPSFSARKLEKAISSFIPDEVPVHLPVAKPSVQLKPAGEGSSKFVFKKTERRAASAKSSDTVDATSVQNSLAWELVPVNWNISSYTRPGSVVLGGMDRSVLEEDPRVLVYCHRTNTDLPEDTGFKMEVKEEVSGSEQRTGSFRRGSRDEAEDVKPYHVKSEQDR